MENIRKMDEYLMRYIKQIDCVRQGRTVKISIIYVFDSIEQARAYVSQVKAVKAQYQL